MKTVLINYVLITKKLKNIKFIQLFFSKESYKAY